MAKFETRIYNRDIAEVRSLIERGILNGSISASLEDSSVFAEAGACCSVQVFERYSYLGGNRLSLTVTLFQAGDSDVRLSAITAGGSQAMFFKLNTFGEEAFLDKLRDIVSGLRPDPDRFAR